MKSLSIRRFAGLFFFVLILLMCQQIGAAAPLSDGLKEQSFVTSDRVRLTYVTGG
jgi:hypothetical protein